MKSSKATAMYMIIKKRHDSGLTLMADNMTKRQAIAYINHLQKQYPLTSIRFDKKRISVLNVSEAAFDRYDAVYYAPKQLATLWNWLMILLLAAFVFFFFLMPMYQMFVG